MEFSGDLTPKKEFLADNKYWFIIIIWDMGQF
jgi:hypothetical protein